MANYHVYIMTNKWNNVLYTGVTNNIGKRVYQHKKKLIEGFTKKYNISKLVYTEEYSEITDAIRREKQIKAGSRKKKLDLIRKDNPEFKEIQIV